MKKFKNANEKLELMTRVIGVLSGKGGVGKTTIVANLSAALAFKFNKKVTVIDCNLTTSHLGMHFGIFHYPKTLNDFLKGSSPITDVIFPHGTGVNIIPASLNLSDLTGIDISNLNNKIKDILNDNDFVFLDIAPGFGKEAVSGMMACQEALLVTTPDLPSVTDVIKAKNVLNDINVKTMGIILNKVTGKKFDLTKEEIAETTGLPVIASIPFRFEVVESLANKTPLVAYRQDSDASVELFRLAATLSNEEYTPPRVGIINLLSRIFRRSP